MNSFLAVARISKLTAGAKILRIAPSTLSCHFMTFGTALGAKLFDHSASGYSLCEQLHRRTEINEGTAFAVDRDFERATTDSALSDASEEAFDVVDPGSHLSA
jgi:hypothetical protein